MSKFKWLYITLVIAYAVLERLNTNVLGQPSEQEGGSSACASHACADSLQGSLLVPCEEVDVC